MLNMDCPGLPTQEGCLRTSRELLRSVSRLVSPDNPSYIRSSRRDYGRRTERLGRTSAGVRPPNRTARTHVGPADIVRYSWARSIMTRDQCQTWAWGRTSSSRTPQQREEEAMRGLASLMCVTNMTGLDGRHEWDSQRQM